MIKVPHYVYVDNNKLSLCITYRDEEEGYCWTISYIDLTHDYIFKSKSLTEAQYEVLDWIRKERLEYE